MNAISAGEPRKCSVRTLEPRNGNVRVYVGLGNGIQKWNEVDVMNVALQW